MKTSTVLAAAAAAVLTQASPLAPRQAKTLLTANLFDGFDGPMGQPTETRAIRTVGKTMFRAEGYAQLCAIMHDQTYRAYALLDGQPNIDAGHPEAGSKERPLFISPPPGFEYSLCVGQQGSTTLPDGTTRNDTWKVRGVRVECGSAVAARVPPAPASVERVGNTFFVHYDD